MAATKGTGDLTLIYVTASQMPRPWVEYHMTHVREASAGAEIISVSREPLDFGTNLVDNGPKCYWNIYHQMMRAAKVATTPYVAIVEDDTLYPTVHFSEFRPDSNQVSYNKARWALFAWDERPMYSMRQRWSNCSLIAPRDYLIECIANREAAYTKHCTEAPDRDADEIPPDLHVGEIGRDDVRRWHYMDEDKQPNVIEWSSYAPIVQFFHRFGSDGGAMRKRHGQIRAWDIPTWGPAEEMVRLFREKTEP